MAGEPFFVVWEDDDRNMEDAEGNREMDLIAGFDSEAEANAYVDGMKDRLGYEDKEHVSFEVQSLEGAEADEMRVNFETDEAEAEEAESIESILPDVVPNLEDAAE